VCTDTSGWIVRPAEQRRTLGADGAVAESGAFRRAGGDAYVQQEASLYASESAQIVFAQFHARRALSLAARGRDPARSFDRDQRPLGRVPFVHRRDPDRFLLRDEAVAGVDDLDGAGLRPFSVSTIAAAAIFAVIVRHAAGLGHAGTRQRRVAEHVNAFDDSSIPWSASRRRTSGGWS
jgi:hypothetical protein